MAFSILAASASIKYISCFCYRAGQTDEQMGGLYWGLLQGVVGRSVQIGKHLAAS